MTFLLSTLLVLWLSRVAFEIIRGIFQILLACLACILGSTLYVLAVIMEISIKILRTAFSSCN